MKKINKNLADKFLEKEIKWLRPALQEEDVYCLSYGQLIIFSEKISMLFGQGGEELEEEDIRFFTIWYCLIILWISLVLGEVSKITNNLHSQIISIIGALTCIVGIIIAYFKK